MDNCNKVIHLTDMFNLLINLFFPPSAVPASDCLGLLFGSFFKTKPLICFGAHVSAVLSLFVLSYFPRGSFGVNVQPEQT